MPRKKSTNEAGELARRIGRNLKDARTRKGMTQLQVAEALDLETTTVSRIETGTQTPSLDRLNALAGLYDVPLASLVADPGESDAFGGLLGEALRDLPLREKEFVYGFAVQYAQHWRASRQK